MKFILFLGFSLPLFSLAQFGQQGALSRGGVCLEHHSNWTPSHASITIYKKFNALKGNIANGDSIPSITGGAHLASNPGGTNMSYVDGKLDQALKFDGVDDHVTLQSGINTQTTVFSVSMWVKPGNSANALNVLFLRGSPTNCHYNPSLKLNNNSGLLEWRESGCGGSGTIATTTISTTAWTHVAAVRNGATNVLYVNGSAIVTTGTPQATLDTTYNGAQMDIGALFDVDSGNIYNAFWNGSMDEFAYWSVALTAGDILKIYDNQKCL